MPINFQKTSYPGHTPEIWRGECKMLPGGFKPKNTITTGTVLHRGTLLAVDFSDMSAAVIKVAKVLNGGSTSAVRVAKGHLFAIGDVVTKVGDGQASPIITAIDASNADYDVLTLSAAYTGLAANDVIVEATEYEAAVEAVNAVDAIEAGYYDATSETEGALKVVASDAGEGEIALADVTPYQGTKTLAANDYVIYREAVEAVAAVAAKDAVPAVAKYTPNMILGAVKEFTGKGLPTLDAAYEAVVLYESLNFPLLPEWLNGCCLKSNPNILFIKQ